MKHSSKDSAGKAHGSSRTGHKDQSFGAIDLQSLVNDAGKVLGELASQFSGETSELLASGRDYIKNKPGKSVAIAAAAGAVIGGIVVLALSRRR